MIIIKRFFLIFSMLIVFSLTTNAHDSKTITILVENDCPYSCKSQNGYSGFIQDILITIFKDHNYKVKFKMNPWLRSLDEFNSKASSVDGIIGMKVHPVRKRLALFPDEEIARYTHRFYALKDSPKLKNWKYEGIQSLKTLKIGCRKYWTYCDKRITKYLNEGSEPYVQALTSEEGTKMNFEKLLAGRIDIWIANLTNTEYFLLNERKAGNESVEKVVGFFDVPITNEVNVYPIFYNDDNGRKYCEIYTDGMKKLQKSGKLKIILKKYGLSEWK